MTHRSHTRWRLLAVLAVFSLFAGACGDDDEGGGGGNQEEEQGGEGEQSTPSTQAAEDVEAGGELVIGAEQEPDCADWISSCGGSSWGYWMMNVTTLPRAFTVVQDGDAWVYEPSDILAEEPTLETEPNQVVTYKLNPDAVWSDGEPITSADFQYTWDQIANGEDIYDKTGYSSISGVETPDPQTAIVTFSTPFSGWKGLFGGGYGILPAHILEGQDRNAMMKDGYDFSGGPWIIESWEKETAITLVPNENYWGEKPKLEKVTFTFVADTAAEFQAFKGGEVSAIYPQPQVDVVEQIEAGLENAQSVFSADTGNLEALWMNNAAAPLDSLAVRQAIAYSIDRAAIVERLFGPLGVEAPMQTLNPPIQAPFADTEAFAGYVPDPDKVTELLEGDGWTREGEFWEKDGERLTLTIKSTAGNARRELTEQVVQEQLAENGIELVIANEEAGTLFGEILPAGEYQMALYAQVLTTLDPGLCVLFCSKNIPGPENENSGQNWQRVNIPELDPLLEEMDVNLDEEARAEAGKAADAIMAENMISLPLDPLPNILIWSDEVAGPISDNPILGPFHNLHEWGLAS